MRCTVKIAQNRKIDRKVRNLKCTVVQVPKQPSTNSSKQYKETYLRAILKAS